MIRDVPEEVQGALIARGALQGKFMQEFLRAQLQGSAQESTGSSYVG